MLHKLRGVWDLHFPEQTNIGPLLEYLKDEKPNEFIAGGDWWDLDCISHWNQENFKNVGFNQIKKTLSEEKLKFENILCYFRHAMPKAKFTYIIGNHEDWLRQFALQYPQMRDFSLESLIDFKGLGITVCGASPSDSYYRVGKLWFCHGHQFGSQNPAKQALTYTHRSVVFGHWHSEITWSDFSNVDEYEKHIAYQVPCYCHMAPEYGKGRPNRWSNGFFWANFKKSGNFCAGIQGVSPRNGTFITQGGVEYDTYKLGV